MNHGYSQSNTEKKHEVAGKMKFPMHGKSTGRGGGMRTTMSVHGNKGEKYSQVGHKVKMHGGHGEIATEAGKGGKSGRGQKVPMSDSKGSFTGSHIYTQHGK